MSDIGPLRALALLGPALMFVVLLVLRAPTRRMVAALLLSFAWNFTALLAVNVGAAHWGFWHFDARGGLLLGVPADLLIGWALLWGPLPLLAAPRWHVGVLVVLALWLDVLVMPTLTPLVQLSPRWLLGEALALGIALAPALLLGRWTLDNQHLGARVALQVACFTAFFALLLPAIVFEATHTDLTNALTQPRWLLSLWLQLAGLAGVMGLSAVQEFALRGGGTPLPFDPPTRIVTSGPYAYVANPMQLSMTCVLLVVAAWSASGWALALCGIVTAYSAGIAAVDEHTDLLKRFGHTFTHYRSSVRPWLPRWRPFVDVGARLYVDTHCPLCSDVGRWFAARAPRGLDVMPANTHPLHLSRITYERGPHDASEGLEAVARALEHIHLGWAYVGWILRLPVVRSVAQVFVDVFAPTR